MWSHILPMMTTLFQLVDNMAPITNLNIISTSDLIKRIRHYCLHNVFCETTDFRSQIVVIQTASYLKKAPPILVTVGTILSTSQEQS